MEDSVCGIGHDEQVAPPCVQLVCAREADGFSVTHCFRARRAHAEIIPERSFAFIGIIVRQANDETLYSRI